MLRGIEEGIEGGIGVEEAFIDFEPIAGILTGLTPGSPELLRAAIRKTRTMTSKPLYVNFLPLHPLTTTISKL